MQGINATIIVQALNFCFTYLILRKFVFAPGVAQVLEDRAVEAQLHGDVSRVTEQIAREKTRCASEWVVEQEKLATQVPVLPEELFVFRHIKQEMSAEMLPCEDDVIAAKKVLAQAIVYSVEAKR
jgi:hypothetical protein